MEIEREKMSGNDGNETEWKTILKLIASTLNLR